MSGGKQGLKTLVIIILAFIGLAIFLLLVYFIYKQGLSPGIEKTIGGLFGG